MSSRTDFELRHLRDGWRCYSYTSWWQEGTRKSSCSGGLTRLPPDFPTAAAAKSWVAEQFAVPVGSWRRRGAKWITENGDLTG
jgi:hypothetical protein